MSVLNDLLTNAIKKDSTWRPKIFIDMAPPYMLPDACDGNLKNSMTDIVPYLRKPTTVEDCQLQLLGYPKGCVYRFDKYKGVESQDLLCNYLCQRALASSATQLIAGSTRSHSAKVAKSVRLQCQHYRKTDANERKFNDKRFQQPGTYQEQENKSSSVKGKSRSASKHITPLVDDSFPCVRFNKQCSPRPMHDSDKCKFALHLICSKSDGYWYLRHNQCYGIQSEDFHTGHLPINPQDCQHDIKKISKEAQLLIENSLKSRIPIPQIVSLLFKQHNVTVSEATLYHERNKLLYSLVDNAANHPYGTEVDQLINEFKEKDDVSFIYVLHNKNTGFVTYTLSRHEKQQQQNTQFVYDVGISEKEMFNWREQLTLSDTTEILVSFAWCHNDEYRNVLMNPSFLSGDMTFGVNRLKRNVYVLNGIDSNNKLFAAMHCFMPSKQSIAYRWVFRNAMPYLFTKDVCSRIQCIATDQEEAEVKPILALKSIDYYKNLRHRLDMFHILIKPWKEVVEVKADHENPMCEDLLNRLLNSLRQLFTYVETEHEFRHIMHQFKLIYKEHKSVIKSQVAMEKIDNIISSIENNKEHLSHHNFMHKTVFGKKGSSISESYNGKVKHGPVCVKPNMRLHTSAESFLVIGSESECQKKR